MKMLNPQNTTESTGILLCNV